MLYYWRFAATIQHSVRYAVLPTTSRNSNFVIDARLLKLILQPNWGCLLTVGTSHISFSSTWFNASIAFEARSGASHRLHAQEWQRLPEGDREEFFKNHGARYFELSRLPYFDPVRMTVVDPMHNILLGKLLVLPVACADSDPL